MGTFTLIQDVLRDVANNATARECALRYGLSASSVSRYRRGKGLGLPGRPHVLTPAEEAVVCKVFLDDEATVSELACILQVSAGTIRNVLKRHGAW